MDEAVTFYVPSMSTGHCRAAIIAEVADVSGVETVDIDLDTKLVRITGENLGADALIAAIGEAGYDATRGDRGVPR